MRASVQSAFDAAAAGEPAISFRIQFGPVLDVLMLALPVDDPTQSILTWYPPPPTPTPPACYFADVTCDGAVTMADVQAAAGL